MTIWIDYKTLRSVDWTVHIEPQSTDHVLIALKQSVKHGMSQYLITDNGKTYANKELGVSGKTQRKMRKKLGVEISGEDKEKIRGIFLFAGMAVKFALPYNAKAKIIERMFEIIHEIFDKSFEKLYAGTTKLRRPESTDKSLKDINLENLPTLEEFTVKFKVYYG